jgi:MFS family permease
MSTGSVAASYRGLFAEPVLRRLAVADVCARLPQGMVSITLLLVVAQHASMAVAGLVVAGYTLGQAVTGPVRGRLADRRGLIPVAVACGTGYALALLGAALAGLAAGRPILALAAGLAAAAAAAVTAAITGARTITRAHSAPRSVERETAPGRSGPRLRRQAHQEVRR